VPGALDDSSAPDAALAVMDDGSTFIIVIAIRTIISRRILRHYVSAVINMNIEWRRNRASIAMNCFSRGNGNSASAVGIVPEFLLRQPVVLSPSRWLRARGHRV